MVRIPKLIVGCAHCPCKRGTVSYWVGNQEHSETDKCYDQDSVLEVWCTEDGSVGFGILECYDSDWCEDGACTSGN